MSSVEKEQAATQPSRSDKLYIENNLLRIAGALFCHDPKRAALRTGEIQLNATVLEKRITIRPDPALGQPGQLAHKIFVALIKKHSDYGRPSRRGSHRCCSATLRRRNHWSSIGDFLSD